MDRQSLTQIKEDNEDRLDPTLNQGGIDDFFNGSTMKEGEKSVANQSIFTKNTINFKKINHTSAFKKLNDKDKEDIYLRLVKENEDLKVNLNNVQKQMKTLRTKQMAIELAQSKGNKGEKIQKINEENLDKIQKLTRQNNNLKLQLATLQQQMELKYKRSTLKSAGANTLGNKKTVDEIEELTAKSNKLSDMTRLVELLKNQLKSSEQENRRLNSLLKDKLQINTADTSDKNVKLTQLKAQYDHIRSHFEHQKKQLDDTRQRVAQLNMELNNEKDNLYQLQAEKRQLQLSLKEAETYEDQVINLTREKNRLEIQLKEIASQPFVQDFKEQANISAKLKQLNQEIMELKRENQALKENKGKLDAELKRRHEELNSKDQQLSDKILQLAEKEQQIQELNSEKQPFKDMEDQLGTDNYMRALGIVKWKGEDPIWTKLQTIDREKKLKDTNDINQLKNEITNLILEKGELASYLEKTQSLLNTKKEYENQKQIENRQELEKLRIQLQQLKQENEQLRRLHDIRGHGPINALPIQQKDGIDYVGDGISVFSTDDSVMQFDFGQQSNTLDVYLGAIDISEPDARILTQELVPNLRNLLSFVTVDFFNHDTQHSTITEGIKSKINFQVSFKVDIDEFLYKHITTNSIKLELYCGNGEEPLKLGEGSIPLLDLDVKNDQPDKSYVLGGTTFIKGFKDNGKQAIEVAVIEYRVRFKYPVFEKFQSIKQQMKLHKELSQGFEEPEEEFYGTSKRKLVFLFDKITNLSEQDSTFIYFSFNGIDYHTTVKEGSQPFWDQEDRIVITILYDEQMRNKFKEDTIEFVIFNDNAGINNNNSRALRTDVIGTCRVPLADLNKANVLDLKLDILSEDDHNNKLKIKNQKDSDNEKKQLFVKILWTDSTDFNQRPQMKQNQQNDTWSQEVTYKIAQALKARYLNLNNSFMIFDRDQDEIISFEDFETTIRGTLGMNQLKKEEIELYYSRLPQPYDWESFSKQFRPYLDHMGKINGIPQFDDNFFIEKKQPDNLSQINQIVQENTNNLYQNKDLQKFEKLREQIHDILGRQMEIQSKSLNQLFLEVDKDNNGFLSHLEFKTFLHKYGIKAQDKELQQFLDCLDKDGDEQINVQEFQDYIMYQGSNISPKKLSSISKRDSESNVNSRLLVNFIDQAIDGIIEYMKQNKKTFLMIYQVMDANGDNYVSKQELKSFLQDKVGLKMNLNELNMVLNHFDSSDDNKISVKEFVETMKDKARSKQRQSRNASDYNKLFTGVQRQRNVSQLIEVFVSYIQLNNLQISTMFNAIDANQDGTLSKKEMKQLFIERLRINIDDDEFNEFYHFFDQNQNDSVSISEFVKVIQPKLEEVKYQKQNKKNYPEDYINLLRKKATDATKRYGDELQQFFEAYEIEQGKPFITKQDFKKQIQNVIPMRSEFYFTDEDLLALIDQICSINLSGFVNYKHFLGLGSEKHHELADNKSMMVSKQMTSEIFKKIRSVLKKEKLSIRKAFQAFDLNRDGKIGAKELYECFKQMGLDYSSDDIDLIVLAVDKNKNGEITFEEFEKALNEAK